MNRIMIQVDEELLRRARRAAARRGVSIAQLVREALQRELGREHQPAPLSLGKFRSRVGDLSKRASHDEFQSDPWRSS